MQLNLSKDILIFFQEMKQFFIKRGQKETMENYFRKFLLYRAKSKKGDFYEILTKSVLNATPFVKLKSKKRRKFTVHKIHPADKEWARRKALGAFAKIVKEQKTKNFTVSLEKEFELLQTGKSSIQTQRDEYHRTALKAAPYK
jgi:ribosomal protein S7